MVEFQVEFLKTLEDGVRLVPDLEKLEKVDQFKVSPPMYVRLPPPVMGGLFCRSSGTSENTSWGAEALSGTFLCSWCWVFIGPPVGSIPEGILRWEPCLAKVALELTGN